MSTETRTIRPFAISRSLATVLSKAVLRFGSDECAAGGRITIVDSELHVRKRAEIHWAPDDESFEVFKKTLAEGWSADGFDPSALALLVIATTPYLKITDVVYHTSCSNLNSMARIVALTVPDRSKAFCCPHHGATVNTFLLLTQALEPLPLRPWRRGTWLARETFRIATEQSQRLFHPKPLDDETRKQLGLPPKTMHYVRMDDVDPLEPYEAGALDLYVDRELLDDLSARPRHPVSRAIQLQLARDVIAAIIRAAVVRENDLSSRTWRDLGDSLLAKVLRIAAKAGASHDQLLREVISDPAKVIARAEAAFDLLVRTREAVRNGDS